MKTTKLNKLIAILLQTARDYGYKEEFLTEVQQISEEENEDDEPDDHLKSALFGLNSWLQKNHSYHVITIPTTNGWQANIYFDFSTSKYSGSDTCLETILEVSGSEWHAMAKGLFRIFEKYLSD